MVSLRRNHAAILAAFVAFLLASASTELTEDEFLSRCKRKREQSLPYPHCMLSTKLKNGLLCDQSNFTSILAPDKHDDGAFNENQARATEILFFNDSCLLSIRKGDLDGYEFLRELYLSYNYITSLHKSAFSGNTKLTTIDLSNNFIDIIEDHSFEGLSDLLLLNLSSNNITELEYKKFKHLEKLNKLDLSGNLLTTIQGSTFRHLKRLTTLNLSGNRIISIQDRLTGLFNLEHLFLDENRVEKVTATGARSSGYVFRSLPALKTLSVSCNKIEKWPESFGKFNRHLRVLNLRDNYIGNFTVKHLEHLNELRNLSLGNNSLTAIEEDLFSFNGNLTFLNLSANYIKEIPGKAFVLLKKLRILLLEDNYLEIPKKEWFIHLLKHQDGETNMQGAHWDCDCENDKFRDFFKFVMELQENNNEWNKTFAKRLEITCDKPKAHKGDDLPDLDFELCLPERDLRLLPQRHYPSPTPNAESIASLTTRITSPKSVGQTKAQETPRQEPIIAELDTTTQSDKPSNSPPGVGSLNFAIIGSLCAVIVIIVAILVMFFKLKTSSLSVVKRMSRRKRNESSQSCIESDPSVTEGSDPALVSQTIHPSNRGVVGRRAPYQPEPSQPLIEYYAQQTDRDSRSENTYVTMSSNQNIGRQLHQNLQHPGVNPPRMPHDQCNNQETTPKRVYSSSLHSQPASMAHDQFNVQETTPKPVCSSPLYSQPATIPSDRYVQMGNASCGNPNKTRRGSAGSFKSCKDLSMDVVKRNSGQLDSSQFNFYSPLSSFNFSTMDRDCGDGAEEKIPF